MSKPYLVTDDILVEDSRGLYGTELIIASATLVLAGFNLCLFLCYVILFWRRDRTLTKVWSSLVILLNAATAVIVVWESWCQSITRYRSSREVEREAAIGAMLAIPAAVMMLVQVFWLTCIWKLMKGVPGLRLFIILPTFIISMASFGLAITVGVVGRKIPPHFSQASQNLFGRVEFSWLSTSLGVDLAIVLTLLLYLFRLKKQAPSLKRSISLLSWVFVAISILSAAALAIEIFLQSRPLPPHKKVFGTLTPLFASIYAFGGLAMLNARATFWQKGQLSDEEAPEIVFVDEPSSLPISQPRGMSHSRGTTFSRSRGESSLNASTEGETEKFHRHTIQVDRETQRQIDFGTLTEP